MASPPCSVVFSLIIFTTFLCFSITSATWCVARSDASELALKTALDYACGSGADCAPIQPPGLCYLPNTMQAHASYAFNSYYQRKTNAPGSCDFSGTATVAKTDPSYGSCVYPASPSQAGGMGTGTTTGTGTGTGLNSGTGTTMPSMNVQPPPGTTAPLYGNGGLTPGFTPGAGTTEPMTSNSRWTQKFSRTMVVVYVFSSCFFSFMLHVLLGI